MYHKGITIGVAMALVLLTITIIDYITQEKYDITFVHAGSLAYPDTYVEKAEKLLSPLCEDVDGNGQKNLYFSRLTIDKNSTDAEFLQANILKLDMAIGEDNSYLFVLEKSIAEGYIGEGKDTCCFVPIEDWATEDISGLKTYDAHGESYGIAVSDLELFKELGLDQENYYLFVRYYPRESRVKEQKKGYEASLKLANEILKY